MSWVYFWKGWETLSFVQKIFNFLIGLYPICFVCVCVGPLWHFNMYLDNIYTCSSITYILVVLVHTKCLIKCPNGILVLFWILMSTKLWRLPWLCMFIMFWSLVVCFTYFEPNVFSHALIMHHICTPHAHLMHTLVHLTCFTYHSS